MNRPNIVWITTHDINPHLGAYAGVWPGAEHAHTPHLDLLASQGVRFDQALATAPVCAPSRASVITGCQPAAIGTMHMRTRAVPPPEVILLPELFREQGYYATNNFFTDYQMEIPGTVFDDIGTEAHWRNRPMDGTPFFAQFHGMATHESAIYLSDEEFAKATHDVPDERRHRPEDVELPPYYPDTEPFRVAWSRYLDLISAMDTWVGSILQQLEDDGLVDDTIVVFWSDHGAGMPRAKRWANEAGTRVPLIIRWPGAIPPDTAVSGVVSLMDLAPTMLSMAGLKVPRHMHGAVLIDADGEFIEREGIVFSGRDRMDEQQDSSRTVRDIRLRYTRHLHPDRSGMQHHEYADKFSTWGEFRRLAFEEAIQLSMGQEPSRLTPLQRSVVAPSKPAEELFDISVDPHETENLVDDPAYSSDLIRLRSALDEWQESIGDLGRLPEAELNASWRPGGVPQQTAPVEVEIRPEGIVASCPTPGARIGWTTVPEQIVPDTSVANRMFAMLGVEFDGRQWKPYTGPLTSEGTVYVKAWRIGFIPSDVVAVEPAPVTVS